MQSPGHQPFTYYYKPTPLSEEKILLELKIKEIFHASKEVYGARKIKRALAAEGITASRQHIRRIMDKLGLVSVYTKAQYKHYDRASDDQRTTPNAINREFQHRGPLEAVVSDLTYMRIPGQWAYVCLITDLYNREIIGYSCGPYKNADLVQTAFHLVPSPLDKVQIFHTDRGREFDNKLIDTLLIDHNIRRSLSRPGNPYDNAVAESVYKSFKTEFVNREVFQSLEDLKNKLQQYVHWWNYERIHGSLGYVSPIAYRHRRDPSSKSTV